jgi:hypothetical protein
MLRKVRSAVPKSKIGFTLYRVLREGTEIGIQRVVELSDCTEWGLLFAVVYRMMFERIMARVNDKMYCFTKILLSLFRIHSFCFGSRRLRGLQQNPIIRYIGFGTYATIETTWSSISGLEL